MRRRVARRLIGILLFTNVLNVSSIALIKRAPHLMYGNAIVGITGGFGTFVAVLFAYVADITDVGYNRTIGIVLAELTLGIAFTIVTLGTGYYIQSLGFLYSAVTGAAFACLAFGPTLMFLPETIHKKKSGSLQLIFTSIAEPVKLYFKQDSRLKQINPTQLGLFGAARLGSLSLLGLVLVFVLKKVLADDTIAVIGAALTVVSYVVEGLAQTAAVLYTGAVFASIGAVETACALLGGLTGNLVYSATLSIMHGFVFFILGGLVAISGIILWIYRWVDRKYPEESKKDIN